MHYRTSRLHTEILQCRAEVTVHARYESSYLVVQEVTLTSVCALLSECGINYFELG